MLRLEKPKFNIDDYAYCIDIDSGNEPAIFYGRIVMIQRLDEHSFRYWVKGETFKAKVKLDSEVFAHVEEALENFKEVIYQ